MFGIGALIRIIRKSYQGIREGEDLDELIEKLENQINTPVLDTFSGIERFDAAQRLLDATLLQRLRTKQTVQSRGRVIGTYLSKLIEEFEMAKKDLTEVPASRAELVAVALALHEISLTLESEVESFRKNSKEMIATQTTELTRAVEAARRRTEDVLATLEKELKGRATKIEHDVKALADTTLRDTSKKLSEHLHSELQKLLSEQSQINEAAAKRQRAIEQGQSAFLASSRRRLSIQTWLVIASVLTSLAAMFLR